MNKLQTLLILFLFFIFQNQAFSWEQLDTNNAPFNGNHIRVLFFDSKGVMWISEGNGKHLYAYKNGIFTDYSSKLANYLNLHLAEIMEDDYGNMIFYSKTSITVFDGKNWYSSPKSLYEDFFLKSMNVYSFNDRIFIFPFKANQIYCFQYDSLSSRYNLNDTLPLFLKNLDECFSSGRVRDIKHKPNSEDILIGLCSKGLIEFNYKTQEWEFIKDDKDNIISNLNVAFNQTHLIDNNYYILVGENVVKIDTNNNVESYLMPNEPDNSSHFTDMQVLPNNKGLLVSKTTYLFYIDNNNRIFKIEKPDSISIYDWMIEDIAFDGEKIWLATLYGGIFKFTIDELLKDLIKVSVENPSYLPTVEVLNIFPNPANSTILNVEMALDEQTSDNLSMTIYNIDGEALGTPSILEQSTYKEYNRFKLELPKLPAGIYFISFDNKKGKRTKSFVID